MTNKIFLFVYKIRQKNEKSTIIEMGKPTRSLTTEYRQPKQPSVDHRLKFLQKQR